MTSTTDGQRAAMAPMKATFLGLVITQAAHSVEEYRGRLYDFFPPARFVSGAISQDREQGFLILNLALVAFGAWCFLWPVRRGWHSAVGFAWVWVAIEVVNGVGHPAWSLARGGYTPGVATAPVLLALALALAYQLAASRRSTIA